jgi:membrane-associated phospholipid phosphatase
MHLILEIVGGIIVAYFAILLFWLLIGTGASAFWKNVDKPQAPR